MLFIIHMLAVVGVVMLVGICAGGLDDDEIGNEEDND